MMLNIVHLKDNIKNTFYSRAINNSKSMNCTMFMVSKTRLDFIFIITVMFQGNCTSPVKFG